MPLQGFRDRNLDALAPLTRGEMCLNPLNLGMADPEGVSYSYSLTGSVLWNDSFLIAK